MEQEIQKENYEKPVLKKEGHLKDATQILVTKDKG